MGEPRFDRIFPSTIPKKAQLINILIDVCQRSMKA